MLRFVAILAVATLAPFESDALSSHGCKEGRCGQDLFIQKFEGNRIELTCQQGTIRVLDGFLGR